eukprot:scaffold524_cov138-Skeletonema_menzelii.AAC.1
MANMKDEEDKKVELEYQQMEQELDNEHSGYDERLLEPKRINYPLQFSLIMSTVATTSRSSNNSSLLEPK